MSAMLPVTQVPPVRVWRLNDYEWVAARTLAEAIDCLVQTTGVDREEAIDDPRALDPADMARLTFVTDEEEPGAPGSYRRHSFAVELQRLIDAGTTFPRMFAATDW